MLGIDRKKKNVNALWKHHFYLQYEFKDYIKVDDAESEDIFDYLFDVGAEKFFLEKGKKISHRII